MTRQRETNRLGVTVRLNKTDQEMLEVLREYTKGYVLKNKAEASNQIVLKFALRLYYQIVKGASNENQVQEGT